MARENPNKAAVSMAGQLGLQYPDHVFFTRVWSQPGPDTGKNILRARPDKTEPARLASPLP